MLRDQRRRTMRYNFVIKGLADHPSARMLSKKKIHAEYLLVCSLNPSRARKR